jgi:ubiquinone/menaquinone biosynthesis C-methylase UbiE
MEGLKLQTLHGLASAKIKRQLPRSSYWAIAQDIIRKTGIHDGKCLEIYGGNGSFGIAMAQITSMKVCLLESTESILKHVSLNLKQNDLDHQIHVIKGTVQQIPLHDHSMNLIVCRKSIFHWHNQTKAFQEIYRVLAPDGVAYIGDDSWNHDKWRITENKLEQRQPNLTEQLNEIWRQRTENIKQKIIQAGIFSFEMNDDEGLRIIIRHPSRLF